MRTHKIVILDDDHFPEGRVSKRVVPEFRRRGIEIIHYKTFQKMREDIEGGRLDRDNLFVLDSSLVDEPNGKLLDFQNTIPIMLDTLHIRHKKIIPASGGTEGKVNNDYFFRLLESRGKVEDWGQRSLEFNGLSGNPEDVVTSIVEYYDVLYPGDIRGEKDVPPIGELSISRK